MTAEPEVLFERRGRLGHIVLNRPRAINALTHGMVVAIQSQLDAWRDDDSVATVLLTGSGERGLCAGGDIVSLYRDAKDGDGAASALFWRDEYRLNASIAGYPKPYVAIMDGLVLGGGIGLSAHGSHRIVTERSRIGMPETGIGFFPDVGGTWLLSHAPGELGTHLALTAGSVDAGDAIAVGLADVFVPVAEIPALASALESGEAREAVASVAGKTPDSALLAQRPWIDVAYATDDVPGVLERLRAAGNDEATRAAETIETKSPTSLGITLEALRRARRLPSLEAALVQEYRLALHVARSEDFVEGVRAQVIDKDRQPRWQPPSLSDVVASELAGYFAPLGDGDLDFPGVSAQTSATTP